MSERDVRIHPVIGELRTIVEKLETVEDSEKLCRQHLPDIVMWLGIAYDNLCWINDQLAAEEPEDTEEEVGIV